MQIFIVANGHLVTLEGNLLYSKTTTNELKKKMCFIVDDVQKRVKSFVFDIFSKTFFSI